MKVRMATERKERAALLEGARQNIWPLLPPKTMRQWWNEEGPYEPKSFALIDDKGDIIGGAIWEIYDHYDVNEVVLDLGAFYVVQDRRRERLGRQLFLQSLAEARNRLMSSDLKVVGLFIESTEEAAPFYREVLTELGFPFSELSRKIGKLKPTFFIVDCG